MTKTSPNEQHQRFLETARKLGCDEDKDRFEAKLGKLATATRPEPKANKKRTTAKAKAERD